MPPCLTPQWQSCLWIRKRPLIEWIGLLCMPLSVEWGLALPFFSGSTCFILAFKVLLMSMVICLLSFLCLVVYVRSALCLLFCMFLLLKCSRVTIVPIHVLKAFVSPDNLMLYHLFRSMLTTHRLSCVLMLLFVLVLMVMMCMSEVLAPGSISPSPKVFGLALGPIVLTCRLALTGRQLKLRFLGFSWAPGT